MVKDIRCPLCNSPVTNKPIMSVENRRSIGRRVYDYLKCTLCDVVFLNPMPTRAELDLLYADEYDMCEEDGSGSLSYAVGNLLSEPRDRAVSQLCAPGRILDIGCGSGVFVARMREKGWDAYGLEVSRDSREKSAQRLGKGKVFPGWEEASFSDGYFDVVTLWHVLEHLDSPVAMAKDIFRVLKKGGFVLVEVPNCHSLTLRIFREFYEHHRIPEHLLYWSKQSLQYLFSTEGFAVFSTKYPLMWPQSFSRSLKNRLAATSKPLSLLLSTLSAPVSFLNATIGSLFGTGEFIRLVAKKV